MENKETLSSEKKMEAMESNAAPLVVEKTGVEELLRKYWKMKHVRLMSFVALIGLIFYAISKLYLAEPEKETAVFKNEDKHNFEGGRTISSNKEIYDRKETLISGRVKNLEENVKDIKNSVEKLTMGNQYQVVSSPLPNNLHTIPGSPSPSPSPENNIKVSAPERDAPKTDRIDSTMPLSYAPRVVTPSVISFPVNANRKESLQGVVLPAGSFVKAKLLTGVEAPEGKPLPVLMQADYAFIGPNKTRVDLSGCFLIAKSTGNLSIERVEMQASKISCVSKSGKMFEREINGFVADDKDQSFAVVGQVNTKQDRVMVTAFLASVVEGIGKAIQTAQTATTTAGAERAITASNVTGDQTRYILGGGAANAATQISTWYLKQAQNLLPTINIGSGRDVWLVMQDSVELPNEYFKKSESKKAGFDYLSLLTSDR